MNSRPLRWSAALLLAAAACHARPVDPAATHPLPPVVISELPPGAASVRFFALGDAGTGRSGQREVAAAMASKARRDGCAFVLLLGDNFYPHGVASADDPLFERDFEDVYDGKWLAVPFFAALGNHDHAGSIDGEIERTTRGTRWCMPDRHYQFRWLLEDGVALDFFAIDTTPIVEGDDADREEVRWLEAALSRSSARWKVVFGHHPIRSVAPRPELDRLAEQVEPLFRRHGVDLYLSGHHHCLEMFPPRDGLACVVSGAGGGRDNAGVVEWTDDVEYAATGGGFVAVRASRDELLLEFVRTDSTTQFARTLQKRR